MALQRLLPARDSFANGVKEGDKLSLPQSNYPRSINLLNSVHMPNQIKVNAMSFALLVKEMLAGEYTCAELAEKTGLHYVTVLHYTREMHKAGSAYICAWRMDKRKQYVLKVYGVGDREDVDKPRKAMTPAQRQLKYRAKLRRRAEYAKQRQQRQDQPAALP